MVNLSLAALFALLLGFFAAPGFLVVAAVLGTIAALWWLALLMSL